MRPLSHVPAMADMVEENSLGTHPLVGAWRLIRGEFIDPDGTISTPWGEDAVGSLLYSPDGAMAATIMMTQRREFAVDDMRCGTDSEMAAAFGTYLAYTGTYEIRGDRVIHHIEASLFPNWTGTDQERLIALAGDRLTLTTPPMTFEGSGRMGRLFWERVDPVKG
jgi:hypothetical protein